MRVADYIFESLINQGIDKVFSVSGRGALFLTDAVAKLNDKLEYVGMHHEQAAGFAANAYAEAKHSYGVALVSTGCASTNLMTAVLCAWQDNLPVIYISGQNTLNETSNFTGCNLRTFGQQEADIIPMVKSITKFSRMVTSANEVPTILEEALSTAVSGRPGPVWIDVPLDLQSSRIDKELIPKLNRNRYDALKTIDENQLNELGNFWDKSNRPVILIGSGIKSSNTVSELISFSERTNTPIVYGNSAVDICGFHPNTIGSVGAMGASRYGNFTIQNSDLVLVLGNRINSYLTGVDFCDFARKAKLVVVDIDEVEHSKAGIAIDLFINEHLATFFKSSFVTSARAKNPEWLQKCQMWQKKLPHGFEQETTKPIDLYNLCELYENRLPSECNLITDSGFIEVILPTNIKFKKGQRSIHPVSQGSMGFALPGAIGAYEGNKKITIVTVGDGSIMMNIQELLTISYRRLPILIVIVNNDMYSIIRRRQKELFRKRTIGTDEHNGVAKPSFEKIAKSFNIDYKLSNNIVEFDQVFKNFISDLNEPKIIEVLGREDQKYLEISATKLNSGKYARRPLEDQFPFMDRELFLSEMIIEPIKQ